MNIEEHGEEKGMPTCTKCGYHDETDADFDNTRTICNTCGPHVLVNYHRDHNVDGYEYGPHVTVTIENLEGYHGDDDGIFWSGGQRYKKAAKEYAKKLAVKQGRNLLVIYRHMSP